ncbi:MAG TPA: hypothetical protein VFK78_07620 [Gemmatimonadales bacterium]|nr:hypothetical protein [Gemmatimonadales bacterium]
MRKSLWIGLQTLLGAVVLYAVGKSVLRNWHDVRASGVHLAFRPVPIALAVLVVLATYALLIESWRLVLQGWDQKLSYPVATRIWSVSNLGRYLPGKVWSVAGMAVLAQQAGVAPWAATGSAIILQALAVGTAVALVVGTIPAGALAAASPAASAAGLAIAFACAAGTIAAVSWPPAARRLFRLIPKLGLGNAPPLRLKAILVGTGATLAAWVAYGVALELWAAGTLGAGRAGLDLASASGAFTASYVIGLLALFAPGGILVREGILFALLQGTIGPASALALAVGSRLLLTFTEIAAALVGLTWRAGRTNAQRSA